MTLLKIFPGGWGISDPMKKTLFFSTVSCLLNLGIESFAQNTMAYTDAESYYHKGVELFQKKVYAPAREEFKHYIQSTHKTLSANEFNLTNAEYYAALSGLYTKNPDADIEIERFVVNHSDHPKAKVIYGDLGNFFYAEGDYKRAIQYLEKATANNASIENIELKYKLAVSYYLTNDFAKALPVFNEIKTASSEFSSHAFYYAGVINYKNESYEAALADLKQVENVAPYKTEVPNWIANILYVSKKYDQLLAYTEPIIEKPNGRKIDDMCLVTAEVCYFRDDFTKAAKYYERYKTFRKGSVSNQVTFRHAYSLYKTENYEKAIENFKKIATQNNELGQQAAYYLGISSLKVNDLNAALAAFERAKASNFDKIVQEEAQFNYAKVAIDMGNSQQGLTELQNYLKVYPTGKYEDEASELMSDVMFEANNYTQAITYIESLKKRTPKLNEAYQRLAYGQGVVDFNAERYTKAIEFFNKSLTQPINNELKQNATFWKAEAAYAAKLPEAANLYRDVVNGNYGNELKQKSKYALGYLHYNNKDYKQAGNYFKDYIKAPKTEANRQNYEDALVRIGDCNLAVKNYEEALKYYDQAIRDNRTEKDYAMYQKALTLTFVGRNQEALQIFDRISAQYPNSRLVDDAWFQNASLELDKGNYQNAVNLLSRMVRERPKSNLIPQALMKRALAYGNLKNHEAALNDYKVIVIRYGKTDVAENALLGLQETLNTLGRSEEFSAIVEEYKKGNPGSGSVEGLEYETAKNLYLNEKYVSAVSALQKFIANYPGSTNAYEAKYYLADAYYMQNDRTNALKYYNQVINDNRTSFVTKSALRVAAIEAAAKNYKNAITGYRAVIVSSSNKRDIVTAWQGLTEAYFLSGKLDSTIFYARETISNGGNIVMGASNKAQLYIGKAYMAKNDAAKAEDEFKKTIAMAKDVNGAEAQYLIGEMQYRSKKHKESIKTLQDLAQQFSEFLAWYEKGFFLIVDNYIAMNDYFMAKATLKSIIDNSETPETVDLARKKLKEIENKE